MKTKITLKQIAKELNVSISTVSKSLSDNPEISIETRERIKAFAKMHNYKPNPIAQSLRSKRTKTVGVIIPEIAHDFFSTVLHGIERTAKKNGYNIITCFSDESFDKEIECIEALMDISLDGFIIAISKETQRRADYHHIRDCINHGMPVVLFDRVSDDISCDKVIVDDAQSTYRAVNQLIETGCHRIAMFAIPDYISVGRLRTQGYKNALIDAQIPIDENLICVIEDVHKSDEQIEKFFNEQKFDAVLCSNEFLALKVLTQAHSRNILVPQQLSIIGMADGFLTQNSYPKMTAIDQHGGLIGEKSMELLIRRLEETESESSFHTEIIPTKLVLRQTTKQL